MYKFLILSVVCAIALANPADRQKRQAGSNCLDAFKNVANPCNDNPTSQVYFPHPTDMSKFIQCDKYSRMYIIQCPNALVYSAATSTCRQAGVVGTSAPSAVATNLPGSSYNPCVASELAAGHIYFAVPGDDTSFIECDMLGHVNILPCPTGLVWNEARLSCVYRPDSQSGVGSVTVTKNPLGSDVNNPCSAATIAAKKLFFPHPDTSKFIQCDLWGDVFVVSCPAGLVWNQYYETCASPFYVQVNGPAK